MKPVKLKLGASKWAVAVLLDVGVRRLSIEVGVRTSPDGVDTHDARYWDDGESDLECTIALRDVVVAVEGQLLDLYVYDSKAEGLLCNLDGIVQADGTLEVFEQEVDTGTKPLARPWGSLLKPKAKA